MSEESQKQIIKILDNTQTLRIDVVTSNALAKHGITYADAPHLWEAIATHIRGNTSDMNAVDYFTVSIVNLADSGYKNAIYWKDIKDLLT